jgi:predicted amidohydrolase
MNSTENKEKNLATARELLLEASREADVLALPEYFNFLGPDGDMFRQAETSDGVSISMLREIAASRRRYIVGGSIAERFSETKCRNTTFVIGPDGSIIGSYSKIHMFDISLKNGDQYRESDRVTPGDRILNLDTNFGRWGFTICYDLRFPEIYRALVMDGAKLVFVPSAFTMTTGRDHWEALLRCRAIENQVYVAAPAQVDSHQGRMCYGRSMIVDPWGTVTAQASDTEGVIYADISMDYLENVRSRIPCLEHSRMDLFSVKE